MNSKEEEVLKNLEGVVKDNLKNLVDIENKNWWPSDFFSFMQNEDIYHQRLMELREESKSLSDEILVVLIGNTVTEEALPNYSLRIGTLFPDRTGISDNPWAIWGRGWNAEEEQHGKVLDQYLLLTGRVNTEAVQKSIFSLIKNGFEQSTGIYKGIFYPMFQEPATRISHLNTGRKAKALGDATLMKICNNIAGDEHRHAQFYFNVGKTLFEQDPENSMIEFASLMKESIVMPARLMTDENYKKPPILFDYFADVATEIGVYTPNDYANILEDLNNKIGISKISVSGNAAEAQDFLSQLPKRIRKISERKRSIKQARNPVEFGWLYNRKV